MSRMHVLTSHRAYICLSPVLGIVSEMRTQLAFTERKLLISALQNEDEKMSENAGRKDVSVIFYLLLLIYFMSSRNVRIHWICLLHTLTFASRDYFNYLCYYYLVFLYFNLCHLYQVLGAYFYNDFLTRDIPLFSYSFIFPIFSFNAFLISV